MGLPNKILLIDDDKINNFLNERLFSKLNIFETIRIFLEGASAFEYLKEEFEKGNDSPELILVDINMPVMNGFEFLENYNKLPFKNKDKVTLIGLTTSLRSADIEKLKSLHCKYTLNKPLSKDSVNTLIEDLKIQYNEIG